MSGTIHHLPFPRDDDDPMPPRPRTPGRAARKRAVRREILTALYEEAA